MAAAGVVYAGTLATVDVADDEALGSRGQRPGHSTPDVAAEDSQAQGDHSASRSAGNSPTGPADRDGYIPTFFDGRGGISGVEFTPEQREAIVREALSRGMSKEEAHELAYGFRPGDEDDGDGAYVLADGEVYRHLTPAEDADFTAASDGVEAPSAESYIAVASLDKKVVAQDGRAKSAAPAAEGSKSALGRKAPSQTGSAGTTAKKRTTPKKPKSGIKDTIKGAVKQVVPDPIEDAVKSLPDGLMPFRMFMADISAPGTQPQFTVYALDMDRDDDVEALQITAKAQVSESVAVTAEVVAPVEKSPEAPPCLVEVTLTDPTTDEVIADPAPVVVHNPEDVSQAAIGEIVDTVVDATQVEAKAESNEIPAQDVSTVVEAQGEAPTDQPAPSEPDAQPVDPPAARQEDADSTFTLAS
ncbi:hypothetical protein [Streptomyces sp. Ag109_G2-6]|uniref:hypothetical protein n=1 Tax=Streptomyces sp. Ag109_G2-6 TaxID=2485154 RepID=UPI000F515C1D|nr:hypothetical protein [Streptomyces sp. Ag109_G2-6]